MLLAPLPGARPLLVHALSDGDAAVRLQAAAAILRQSVRPYLR
jgi:hypothetical protein